MADTWGGSWGSSWGVSWHIEDLPPTPEPPPQEGGVDPRARRRIRPQDLSPVKIEAFFLQPWQQVSGRVEVSDQVFGTFEADPILLAATVETSTDVAGTLKGDAGGLQGGLFAGAMRKDAPRVIVVRPEGRAQGSFEQPAPDLSGSIDVQDS